MKNKRKILVSRFVDGQKLQKNITYCIRKKVLYFIFARISYGFGTDLEKLTFPMFAFS